MRLRPANGRWFTALAGGALRRSVAVDGTRLSKTGRCIQQAFYQRDPLSPPIHVNLTLGLRLLQASLLVPTYRLARVATRGLPIRFEEVPRVKKPSRNAKPEAWQEYKGSYSGGADRDHGGKRLLLQALPYGRTQGRNVQHGLGGDEEDLYSLAPLRELLPAANRRYLEFISTI